MTLRVRFFDGTTAQFDEETRVCGLPEDFPRLGRSLLVGGQYARREIKARERPDGANFDYLTEEGAARTSRIGPLRTLNEVSGDADDGPAFLVPVGNEDGARVWQVGEIAWSTCFANNVPQGREMAERAVWEGLRGFRRRIVQDYSIIATAENDRWEVRLTLRDGADPISLYVDAIERNAYTIEERVRAAVRGRR